MNSSHTRADELSADAPSFADDADHARERLKSGRNDPCPCGSAKKYKKCCLGRDEALVRQSPVARQVRTDARAERVSPITGGASGAVPDAAEFSHSADSAAGMDSEQPPEVQRKADALWDAFQTWKQPTSEQMDTFLGSLLALPPELTSWSDLLH